MSRKSCAAFRFNKLLSNSWTNWLAFVLAALPLAFAVSWEFRHERLNATWGGLLTADIGVCSEKKKEGRQFAALFF